MALVDDQDPVEQFPAQGFPSSFADRMRPRCSGWIGKDPDRTPWRTGISTRNRNVIALARSEMSISTLRAASLWWSTHRSGSLYSSQA